MAPTIAQQRAIAFAPIPIAVISFLSSGFVVHHLLFKERQKLERLYHRLVLAMNIALLPLTSMYAWSTFAVPTGTPDYVGASGTTNTCTAQGFLSIMLVVTVPVYYGALGLQAYMSIRNKFQEEKYRWNEKYIHFVAWCFPAAFATLFAATENINPNGSGCFYGKSPVGCEADPNIDCVRGKDVAVAVKIMTFGLIFLYFILPPSVMMSMYCWIRRIGDSAKGKMGMHRLRVEAKKRVMNHIAIQISLYLFSFWCTFLPSLISTAYQISTGKLMYDLVILCNCIFALQGFIMAAVYFGMERLGRRELEIEFLPTRSSSGMTVRDIRESASLKTMAGTNVIVKERFSFNIFDGTPDKDSPWAKYLNEDDFTEEDRDDEDIVPPEGGDEVKKTFEMSE